VKPFGVSMVRELVIKNTFSIFLNFCKSVLIALIFRDKFSVMASTTIISVFMFCHEISMAAFGAALVVQAYFIS